MAPIFFLACFSKSSRIRQKLKMQKFLHILEEQTKKNKKLLQKKNQNGRKFKMATKTKFACKNYKPSFLKKNISGLF
jgi:hypothetical protein